MGDLSKNFSRKEFECKCGCGFNTVDAELLKVLQELAFDVVGPISDGYTKTACININSGCRCDQHNKNIGGKDGSYHKKGKAADIAVSVVCFGVSTEVDPPEIYQYITAKYPNKYGIGLYDTFVHIDVREKKARW